MALDQTPTSPAALQVALDGTSLTEGDPASGFTYDPITNSVMLGSGPCATAGNGQAHTIVATD